MCFPSKYVQIKYIYPFSSLSFNNSVLTNVFVYAYLLK